MTHPLGTPLDVRPAMEQAPWTHVDNGQTNDQPPDGSRWGGSGPRGACASGWTGYGTDALGQRPAGGRWGMA